MAAFPLSQIKANIASARKQAGLTQEQMAKLLDITQPAYSYYESGDKPIPLMKIHRISELLCIDPSELLGSTDQNRNQEEILLRIDHSLKRIADCLEKLSSKE